ncbi:MULTISPECIES: sn-glycerol-1-phosphate dehydrogenase [Bacillaceae]|uniref:sn-glycerol-1-phosphate dehydrogenase n=1 Tax=Bacillaceae TaxID=186817 RepID=UPI001F2CEAB9|nr:sn-glycerol-1-phosphate dehydrogenase [Litchfieldia alkalitelluris]
MHIDHFDCSCGNQHYPIEIEKIHIGNNTLDHIITYIMEKGFKNAVIVSDDITSSVIGKKLSIEIREKTHFESKHVIIEPNDLGDVVADERSLIQLMIESPSETDIFIAAGAGTIHDITRFVSFKMGKPFLSVPTAPSVDGYTSMGAPLIVKEKKITFQTHAPIAMFADLKILMEAPTRMIAAGFGDILGKATSLADWKFDHLMTEKPFCPTAYDLTKKALDSCILNVDLIATKDEDGIKTLMEALVHSGLAMLIIGQSFPASGAEHHVSHYWEMDFIQKHKPQKLHGEKVAVACGLVATLYKSTFKDRINETDLVDKKDKVFQIIDEIPDHTFLKSLVRKVGGETSPSSLGISEGLVNASLKEAHLIRDRLTMLAFYNKYFRHNE